jgi:hypothetical protein
MVEEKGGRGERRGKERRRICVHMELKLIQ